MSEVPITQGIDVHWEGTDTSHVIDNYPDAIKFLLLAIPAALVAGAVTLIVRKK